MDWSIYLKMIDRQIDKLIYYKEWLTILKAEKAHVLQAAAPGKLII